MLFTHCMQHASWLVACWNARMYTYNIRHTNPLNQCDSGWNVVISCVRESVCMCNHVAQSFVCVGCKQKHKLKGKTAACVRLLPLKWKKIANTIQQKVRLKFKIRFPFTHSLTHIIYVWNRVVDAFALLHCRSSGECTRFAARSSFGFLPLYYYHHTTIHLYTNYTRDALLMLFYGNIANER